MIRRLEERDREPALSFLDREHELNLVLIYDLTHFGLEDHGHPLQGRYYGSFQGDELGGIAVLFNLGSLFIYAPEPEAAAELARHMAFLERKPRYLIGHAEWTGLLLDRLRERGLRPAGVEEQEFLTLTPQRFRPRSRPGTRFAVPADLERLMELNRGFQREYFGALTETEEELGRMAEMRMEGSGISVAEADGEIVSKAEIMVRTSRAALIGGVYTVPEHRGKGLSGACMSRLCERVLADMEKACLNVAKSNAPAQRVYRGLGFEKLCDFRMARFA